MKRALSFLFALLLCLSLIPLTVYAEETEISEETQTEQPDAEKPKTQETFRIRSKEDYLRLAVECGIDSWSLNRSIYLLTDLDFTGDEFVQIPILCGSFYGGGHCISGVEIKSDGSHAGIFRYVSDTGIVKSLNASGTVTPGGTAVCVGGIAGTNAGLIAGCSFKGTVSGLERVGGIAGENQEGGRIVGSDFSGTIKAEHMAGGIAGSNDGAVEKCTGAGAVNNVRISVSDSFSFDVSEITSSFSSEDFLNITDIGGIAGYNGGIVSCCTNSGPVGYNRMGYNVGGIAGRSGGSISSCKNTGKVNGRKDVGGIAGQLEPYTFWSFSKSKLEELDEQIRLLDSLTDDALKESDGYNRQMKTALNEFSAGLKTTVAQLGTVLDSVEKSAVEVSDALDKIKEISSSGESGTTTPEDISEIIGGMTGEGNPDKLEQITEIVNGVELETPDFDPLVTSLNALADSGSRLTSVFGTYAGVISDNVKILLDQTNNIYAGFTDTAEYLKNLDGDYTSDISAEAIDEYALGSVSLCSNSADVSAETNAGGIVGAAAVEFSFDVEDELNISDYLFTDPSYMIYAVIRNCESYGNISAVKACAGGTVGRMDFGAAGYCTSAGEIKVSGGDYCGGIAGKSVGTVLACCSRVQLSGGKYVGGIAGESCNLKDCRSYAFVNDADEYFGTVAGSVSGDCSGNYFVSNGMNGIDNISYSGIAEPLEYSQMAGLEDVPDIFKDITVTFSAEGTVVERITVPFGGTISELPRVPQKDGMYWKWDSFDADAIYYSFTVEGRYCSPITTLTTCEDPPLLLAQGSFYEGQSLQAIPFSPETGISKFDSNEVLMAYTLSVSDFKGPLTFRIRSENDGILFLQNQDGSYSAIDFERDGSYLVFKAQNGDSAVLVRSKGISAVSPALYAAAAGACVLTMVMILIKRKRHNKRKTVYNEIKEKENVNGNL